MSGSLGIRSKNWFCEIRIFRSSDDEIMKLNISVISSFCKVGKINSARAENVINPLSAGVVKSLCNAHDSLRLVSTNQRE